MWKRMNFCLYKLKFLTPVHIGNGANGLGSSEITIHSDTLFSALCIEAKRFGLLDSFYEAADKGRLAFSDLLPFKGEELYLPKPVCKMKMNRPEARDEDIKSGKKLKLIPVRLFDSYLGSLEGKCEFDAKGIYQDTKSFAVTAVRSCVALKGLEQSLPYYVGVTFFEEGCGLYLVLGYEGEQDFELFHRLMAALSYSGIGGKRSAGLGKFSFEAVKEAENEAESALFNLLSREASTYMTLNVSLPEDSELDKAVESGYYGILRRGGFVQSESIADKKKEIYAFAPGSCFKEKYKGFIADVALEGAGHSVYRMLKPMFVGVNV